MVWRTRKDIKGVKIPIKIIKNSFNSGEHSEYLTGRTDLAKYFTGCSELVNGNVLTYGGVEKRPGTVFAAIAKGKARVMPFEFSVDDTHVLEMGANYVRFFKAGVRATKTAADLSNWNGAGSVSYEINDMVEDIGTETGNYYYCNTSHTSSAGADITAAGDIANWTAMTADPDDGAELIYELYTPYSITEVFGIHYTQSADVMYLASDSQYPHKITRLADDSWTIAVIEFEGGPFLEENTDTSKTLTFTHTSDAFESPYYHLAGATGTLSSSDADPNGPFLAGHVGSLWKLKLTRVDDVTVELSAIGTTGAIRIKGDFSVDATGFSTSGAILTLQRREGDGEWQDYRTFTSAVAYTGNELFDDVIYRLTLANASIDAATLTAREQTQDGVVRVLSFTNTASVEAEVVNDLYHSNDDPITVAGLRYGLSSVVDVDVAVHSYVTGDRVFFTGITHVDYSYLNSSDIDNPTSYVITVPGASTTNFTLDGTETSGGNSARQTTGVGTVQDISSTTSTSMFAEGSWSTVKGFPRAISFHEDRLWWAGTTNNPQTLWGSQVGDYENHLFGVFDNEATIFTINDNDVSQIQWLASKGFMAIGTAGREYTMSASNPDNPITPSDVKVIPQSAFGSDTLQPVELYDRLFFIQRSGRKMRGMKFELQSLALESLDANRLHNTILESSPVDIAVQKSSEGIIYIIRADGVLASFTYEPTEDVAGWSRNITGALSQAGFSPIDGKFESVCVTSGVTEDVITFSVLRTINDVDVRYIEYFAVRTTTDIDESVLMDSVKQVVSGNDPLQIICATDTVRYNAGLYGSGFYGGSLS